MFGFIALTYEKHLVSKLYLCVYSSHIRIPCAHNKKVPYKKLVPCSVSNTVLL